MSATNLLLAATVQTIAGTQLTYSIQKGIGALSWHTNAMD
jgi:hypothetical protein